MSEMKVSAECRNTLIKAKKYSAVQYLSKVKLPEHLAIFDFTEEEIACIIANLTPDDFKTHALNQARWCLDEYLYSKAALYERLVTRDLFTKEEAEYALANLNADFKEIALQFATKITKQRCTYLSKHCLYEKLTGRYGYQFTKEEADYVLEHIGIDYKQQALAFAVHCAMGSRHMTKEEIYYYLTSEEESSQFTKEEAEYAIEHLNEAIAKQKREKAENLFMQQCRQFAPDETAYTLEKLDSAEESFDLYCPDAEEAHEEQNGVNETDEAQINVNEMTGGHENGLPGDNEEDTEQNAAEQANEIEPDDTVMDGSEDEYDFPEPYFEDLGMIPDPHTCLDYVAEYEEWADRARECGLDDLAEQYEEIAARWRYLYEEAEDEEMEW